MTGEPIPPIGGTLEKTLALIKPDAVRAGKADEIVQLAELAGFKVVKRRKFQLTKQRAEEFYAEHKGKPFFSNLIGFMTSGPIYAMVLGRANAVKEWRELMGPTNSHKAQEESPKSLRALYGTDGTMNATHGSDSQHSARREIKFYFPEFKSLPITDQAGCKKYILDNIQPTLIKGLTVLAKEKPSASKFEALTFLATWLLENNPNKPVVVGQMDLNMEEDEDDEAEFNGFEEELDLEDPELNVAATKIQASFRGSQTRKDMVGKKPPSQGHGLAVVPEDSAKAEALKEATSSVAGSDAPAAAGERVADAPVDTSRDSTVDAELAAINLEDPELNVAATMIQAGFRGHQARAHVATLKPDGGEPAKKEAAEEVDLHKELPLDDPELGAAATKIQAGFRGHQARADLAAKKAEPDIVAEKPAAATESDLHKELPLDDPELDAAATKIQASFRGHQTRKEMPANTATYAEPAATEPKAASEKEAAGEPEVAAQPQAVEPEAAEPAAAAD